ncbi:Autophagy protein 7 [Microbotryomycetes sp. JL221]|nr:Autophagy protein 7 [Microbotryomycetes sp. JL221]
MDTTPLQFLPWQSTLSPSFWSALTQFKLFVSRLDDAPTSIEATYERGRALIDRETGEQVGTAGSIEFDGQQLAFESTDHDDASVTAASTVRSNDGRRHLRGTLRNFNTIEDFKRADKNQMLTDLGDELWDRIRDPNSTPQDLNPFLLITFADLKKYKYYYWLASPVLVQKPGWQIVDDWRDWQGPELSVSEAIKLAKPSGGASLEYADINTARSFFDNVDSNDRLLVLTDPSAHSTAPGWLARNILSYLSISHGVTSLRLVLVRHQQVRTVAIKIDDAATNTDKRPAVVGWEKNEKGKLGPRMADLAPLMDPTRLADQAVDLNLQLMRWRIMPSLDLDKVKNTRALLLGAGTLGCYVARTLMAWGVRKITLVDSSTVSFSNPVRQPLFDFQDSMNGGKPKAETAAAALKRIYPGVASRGVSLSIPMPGHPVPPSQTEKTRATVTQLEQLIEDHDVVYLLMDSRESRWLPTVIGASKRKLVMNVALGFDTFLVMRHGVRSNEVSTVSSDGVYKGRLGCYYCNDIVAPMDSLSDRTLDQMCTVTRPGIASIASSTAVELMVSILQHPKGALAPSDVSPSTTEAHSRTTVEVDVSQQSPLGIVPHQIRGFLAQFNNLKITGQAYDRCTGCSDKIVSAYEQQGFDMLLKAFEDAKYLEQVTGLDKLSQETEDLLESLEWSEEENDDDNDVTRRHFVIGDARAQIVPESCEIRQGQDATVRNVWLAFENTYMVFQEYLIRFIDSALIVLFKTEHVGAAREEANPTNAPPELFAQARAMQTHEGMGKDRTLRLFVALVQFIHRGGRANEFIQVAQTIIAMDVISRMKLMTKEDSITSKIGNLHMFDDVIWLAQQSFAILLGGDDDDFNGSEHGPALKLPYASERYWQSRGLRAVFNDTITFKKDYFRRSLVTILPR